MSSFIELTNRLLRRINEVEISPADFANTRGVQSLAKDAVKASIARINQAEFEWPFNAVSHTQTLEAGREEYSWPQYFKVADWNSFQLKKDAELNTNNRKLDFISRDLWYRDYKDADDDAESAGIGAPVYVFQSHGNGFGVTPSPDKAYTIQFRYYFNFTELVNSYDQTRIPPTYDHVIIDGALYHMYLYRDNTESAGITLQVFQQGVKEMQSVLINQYDRIRDTRISRVVRAKF
jgi:hypothetical protein